MAGNFKYFQFKIPYYMDFQCRIGNVNKQPNLEAKPAQSARLFKCEQLFKQLLKQLFKCEQLKETSSKNDK